MSKDTILLLLIIIVFSVVSLYKIELPGLYEVESYNLIPVVDLVYNKTLFNDSYSWNILNRRYPLMLTPFRGALDSYILMPIAYLFGLTVKIVRISQVIFAVLGILFTYILCRRIFNKKIALLTVFLLSINPLFIAFNRQGILVNSINFPLLGLGIFLIFLWSSKKKIVYLYTGFFVLGLPLFNNANFIWCLVALGVSYCIIYRNELQILFKNKELDEDRVVNLICFLLLGAFPFIWYNLQYWETLRYLFINITSYIKEEGLFWYFKGLVRAIKIFTELLTSSWRPESWEYPTGVRNYLYPVMLLLSFIFTPIIIYRRKDKELFKKTIFIISTLILILLQSIFALKDLNAYSLYMIYPFVQIIIAIFIVEIFRFLKKLNMVSLFLAIFTSIEIFGVITYFREINKTGGRGYFSPRIYDLVSFLKESTQYNPVAMDWGFRYNLWVLSRGKIDAQDFYSMNIDKKFYYKCDELIKNRNNIYLTHHQNIDAKNIWRPFKKYVTSKGFELKRIDGFYKEDKDEEKSIILYKLY